MNRYADLKLRQQQEFDAFPMIFAFSDKQLAEGMDSLGLAPTDTDKIYKAPGGGFYRKEDSPRLKEMMDRFDRELQSAISGDETSDGFVYEMFFMNLAITSTAIPTISPRRCTPWATRKPTSRPIIGSATAWRRRSRRSGATDMEKLEQAVSTLLDALPGYYRQEDGTFACEIYADYRDEMDSKTAIRILRSEDTVQTFWEQLAE